MDKNNVEVDLYDKNEDLFKQLFTKHFRELHAYAFSIVKDWDIAEELVQGQFLKLWEKNEWGHIKGSIKSYLYKSVYHDGLNYLRRQKIELKYQNSIAYSMKNHSNDTAGKLKLNELEQHLQSALNKLPEKCRIIFHLSRFEELKYQEIASQLNISIKTVETHMGKALRILRKEMKEFLPLIVLIFLNMLRP
jgi:RNA polymerase sigma-70 factor (ECF subfamily)